MAEVQFPFINGHAPDWSSCTFKFFGKSYTRIKSLNYNDNFDTTMVRGNHPEPISETRGEYKADGDVEFYLDEFKRLVTDLGPGWREVRGLVTAAYRDGDQPVTTDSIIGVRFVGVDASQSQGTDPLVRKLKLSMFRIDWNGIANLAAPLTGVGA